MGLHGRARYKPGGDRFDAMREGALLAEVWGTVFGVDDYEGFRRFYDGLTGQESDRVEVMRTMLRKYERETR